MRKSYTADYIMRDYKREQYYKKKLEEKKKELKNIKGGKEDDKSRSY